MKVKELILLLLTLDQDKYILMQGCDCYQEPSGEVEEVDDNTWLLKNNTKFT